MLSFQLDIWCIKSIRQTDIKLDYRHHLIFAYRLRFSRRLWIHVLSHSVSLCLANIGYDILSNFRFVHLIREVEICTTIANYLHSGRGLYHCIWWIEWMHFTVFGILWVHSAQAQTNERTFVYMKSYCTVVLCTLQFDIYNQNGNLFGYETTLRLKCIKWQLPPFVIVLKLNLSVVFDLYETYVQKVFLYLLIAQVTQAYMLDINMCWLHNYLHVTSNFFLWCRMVMMETDFLPDPGKRPGHFESWYSFENRKISLLYPINFGGSINPRSDMGQ